MEISKVLIPFISLIYYGYCFVVLFFFPPLARDFSKCVLNTLNVKLGSYCGLKFECYSHSYFNIKTF